MATLEEVQTAVKQLTELREFKFQTEEHGNGYGSLHEITISAKLSTLGLSYHEAERLKKELQQAVDYVLGTYREKAITTIRGLE